jgi:hypothetical protein
MSDMNWRDKDDLDLTSEDIDAMVAEGELVGVRGPLPGGACFIRPAMTEAVVETVPLRAPALVGGGMRVVQPTL